MRNANAYVLLCVLWLLVGIAIIGMTDQLLNYAP